MNGLVCINQTVRTQNTLCFHAEFQDLLLREIPTLEVIDPQHKNSVLNSAFASEYGDWIANSRIDIWIYGHSHTNIDTEIGSTKVICNQMGYIFANEHIVNGFDPKKHVEI